ncbi:10240_t:CDS:1 [Diversispora eburnea]|uniref:10240_t:CDS:1 n=1 Tax=Diversispora eburnea TaxID=1213867 RepID=A0A9N8V3P3_9GLOM|nr:10240_t:CDS:1 [Diversispora eburnea]
MTSLGVKGQKSNTANSGGASYFTSFTKQQVSELQNQFSHVNHINSNNTQQSRLLNIIFKNFSIFKSFTPLPAPVPITFSRTPLRVCKAQRIGLTSNYTFLQPIGTRNVFGSSGARNFSTTMFNKGSTSGGVVLAQLGVKPFSALATKTGALWTRMPEDLSKNTNSSGLEKHNSVGLKIEAVRKLFVQSKGILDAVQKQQDGSDDSINYKPRVVRRANIKKFSRKNKVIVKTSDKESIENNSNVQVYMSFILSSSLFWDFDETSNSMESSHSSVNSLANVVTHLMRQKNRSTPNKLDPMFIRNLRELVEIQHNHMLEVISILTILQKHDIYDIKVFGCELRVNFPRGMSVSNIENLLKSLGIALDSPHFELEVIDLEENIELLPNPPDDVQVSEPNYELQFQEPTDTLRDTDMQTRLSSTSYTHSSILSISPASPSHIPSPGSISFISAPPSPCMSPWQPVQPPPKLGQEYFRGIEEFLTDVDDLLDKSSGFGKRGIKSKIVNTERGSSEIGESYFEI